MLFNLADVQVDLTPTELDPVMSEVSGFPIRRIELELFAGSELIDRLEDQLRSAGQSRSEPEPIVDGDGGRWVLEKSMSREVDTANSVQTEVTATLRAVEEFAVTQAEFLGLVLPVESFRPLPHDGEDSRWAATIAVVASGELAERLEDTWRQVYARDDEDSFFPLTLTGIDRPDGEVRFGRVIWEWLPKAAGIRCVITFVAKDLELDRQAPGGFALMNQPKLKNLTDMALGTKSSLNALITALVTSGVLEQEAADLIRSADGNEFRWALSEAENVDWYA